MNNALVSRTQRSAQHEVRSGALLSRDRLTRGGSRFCGASLRFATCCTAPGTRIVQQ
jgi:hypothetical protein